MWSELTSLYHQGPNPCNSLISASLFPYKKKRENGKRPRSIKYNGGEMANYLFFFHRSLFSRFVILKQICLWEGGGGMGGVGVNYILLPESGAYHNIGV